MRHRLTNTRKRTNLKSHLSNIPTQHLLVRVKNLYVTGRHKLRHTPYTGKEKRAEVPAKDIPAWSVP
jgi:hypothetical protein